MGLAYRERPARAGAGWRAAPQRAQPNAAQRERTPDGSHGARATTPRARGSVPRRGGGLGPVLHTRLRSPCGGRVLGKTAAEDPMRLLSVVIPLSALLVTCRGATPVGPASTSPPAAVASPADGSESDAAASLPSPSPAFKDQLAVAATGVSDPWLRDFLQRHWAWTLVGDPVFSSELGVGDFDDQLARIDADAQRRRVAVRRSFSQELNSRDLTGLSPDDLRTVELIADQLDGRVAAAPCEMWSWNISTWANPVDRVSGLAHRHRVESREDAENLLSRYRAAAKNADVSLANLRYGASQGRYGQVTSIQRTLQKLRTQLQAPLTSWQMARPAQDPHPDWDPAALSQFRAAVMQVLAQEFKPAVERWVTFVETEILPHARSDDQAGLRYLPDGEACYAGRIRYYTTLPLTAQELHELGHRQIDTVNGQMRELGHKLFGTRDLAAIIHRLRTDKDLYFKTEEEIETFAREALAAAEAKAPQFFGILPQAPCEVLRTPAHDAPYSVLGYYRDPAPDGSRPGQYFINTYQPQTRPRFEAMVLAIHESVPGHHTQVTIAQERNQIPAFRRHGSRDVYGEGWALYSERVGEDMGLYRDDLDRMGALSFEAWRSARLVVDTGIHHLGWSRQQAEAYMLEHTALTPANISSEVDRYINTPAQALAYKVGQLEILDLRAQAERELGEGFDLRTFHDAILEHGAVTAPVLRRQVEAYIAREKAQRPDGRGGPG
ncbi:MAG: DUF885 domain-containing protein [Myxococcales bacterium FL481]|nr:MAG: DUF885 domain-containing protein [Myxococcales bacterium FL481]